MIRKISLNLNFIKEKNALNIQDEIVERLKQRLPHEAEKIFNELSVNKQTQIVIDKLEIDLGILPDKQTAQLFMRRLTDQLRESLHGLVEKKHTEGVTVKNTGALELDAFFFFLEKGYFPWWYALDKTAAELKQERPLQAIAERLLVDSDKVFFQKLVEAEAGKRTDQFARLYYIFSAEKKLRFFEGFFQYVNQEDRKPPEEIRQKVNADFVQFIGSLQRESVLKDTEKRTLIGLLDQAEVLRKQQTKQEQADTSVSLWEKLKQTLAGKTPAEIETQFKAPDKPNELSVTDFRVALEKLLQDGIWPEVFAEQNEKLLQGALEKLAPEFVKRLLRRKEAQAHFVYSVPFFFQKQLFDRVFYQDTAFAAFKLKLQKLLMSKLSTQDYQWMYANILFDVLKNSDPIQTENADTAKTDWDAIYAKIEQDVRQKTSWGSLFRRIGFLLKKMEEKHETENIHVADEKRQQETSVGEAYSWNDFLQILVQRFGINKLDRGTEPKFIWRELANKFKMIFGIKPKENLSVEFTEQRQSEQGTWLANDLGFMFASLKYFLKEGKLPQRSPYKNIQEIEAVFWLHQKKTTALTASYLELTLQDYRVRRRLFASFSSDFADAVYKQVFQRDRADISDAIDKAVWKQKKLELPDDFGDFVHRSLFMQHRGELQGAISGLLTQHGNRSPKKLATIIFETIFGTYRKDILTIIEDAVSKSEEYEFTKEELEQLYQVLFEQQRDEVIVLLESGLKAVADKEDNGIKAELLYKLVFEGRKQQVDKLLKNAQEANSNEIKQKLKASERDELYEKLREEKFDWKDGSVEKDAIYVENAGLVILWTFLPHIFKRLGLIKLEKGKNVFVDKEAQERAVILSQFVVVGDRPFEEHELVLNKLMCGWPVSRPVNMNIQLTENEKDECVGMLKAVVKHWSALGNSSPEALQESFLQRNGVIVYEQENVNLKVEQKGVDVLIDKLPWGFSTIRFSWNDYFIFVEWNA